MVFKYFIYSVDEKVLSILYEYMWNFSTFRSGGFANED